MVITSNQYIIIMVAERMLVEYEEFEKKGTVDKIRRTQSGSNEKLMQQKGFYQELWNAQA